MPKCPHCGHDLDLAGPAESMSVGSAATESASEGSADGVGTWTPVVRAAHVAEAGYLEDLLADAGIASRTEQVDDFNAVDGGWTIAYVLKVPDAQARHAAHVIRGEIAEPAGAVDGAKTAPQVLPGRIGVLLRLVALVALALALTYVSSFRLFKRPGPRDGRIDGGRPEARPAQGDRPRFRIRFDRQRQEVLFEEDRDGDGKYDRIRRMSSEKE